MCIRDRRCEDAGVDIRLNTEVTPEEVAEMGADVVMTAVGAKPIIPQIPGIDNAKVTGLKALESETPAVGQKVAILGGGLVGSEVAKMCIRDRAILRCGSPK